MKTKLHLSALFFLISITIYSQNSNFYYYKGEKIFLNHDKNSIYLGVNNNFQKSVLNNENILDFSLKNENSINQKWTVVTFQNEPNSLEYIQKINSIKNINSIENVSPCFITSKGDKIALSKHFYVKLKNESDFSLLEQKAQEYNFAIIKQNEFMPLWYSLECTKYTVENALTLSNLLYESGLFKTAFPNFISLETEVFQNNATFDTTENLTNCINDTYFNKQWGLENTGQQISSFPNIFATNGIDINACQAWNITTGNNNIKVAVIDQGIDLNHPELTNIHPLSYDCETGTSPSNYYGQHGTACAGVIGATQNNNTGISGVSPNCQLMSISTIFSNSENLANGINWAWQNGADVVNNSWYQPTQNQLLDDALINALTLGRNGKGCVVVFASGNSEGSNVTYPANSNDDFLVVGAISPCGERKNPSSCDGQTLWGSAYGSKIDVMAPGTYIPTTKALEIDNSYFNLNFEGTSSAAPHVAGIAALILSVNPNLTNIEVNNIIESTAQKVNANTPYSYQTNFNRPNGTWNIEMGYGLVDANASVVLAQSMNTNDIDLYTKDTPQDFGIEPNNSSSYTFLSEDIWVRHLPDGLINSTHQTPITNTNNYVYVKIRNKGSVASNGNEQLYLYWSTYGLIWPYHWIDNYGDAYSNQLATLFGDEAGNITIPSIAPGEETILEFNMGFYPPFPGLYGSYYNLLTRIISIDDPILNETSNIHNNILNNNNIASKNVYVSNGNEPFSRTINSIYNPESSVETYNIEFKTETNEYGKAIYDEAEISIELSQDLFDAWDNGGKQGNNYKTTNNEKTIVVTNNNCILNNVTLQPNKQYFFNTTFNFLTKELTNKNNFNYILTQHSTENNTLIDVTHINIQKEPRPLFVANAGDNLEIDENQSITISAEQINEAAIYNWYDTNGNLIYTGKDLTVSSDITKKYKLEIIAITDGFKDYDEVEVILKPSILETITPNPTSNNTIISYKLNGVQSAYITIMGYYGGNNTSNNYILDTNNSEISIDITNYQNGFYTLALVCDGQIVDAKTLIKQ